jgi:hypothetical protein
MLSPIDAHELPVAADGIPNVEAFEYSETINPFTQEPIRFYTPGIKVAVEGQQPLILRLADGRLYCNEVEKLIPEQVRLLAQRLGAHIFPNDD